MKLAVFCALSGMMLLGASAATQAENRWSNYRGVDTTRYQPRPDYPQNHYPQNSYPQNQYPHHQQHYPQRYPNYPQHPSRHPHYPVIRNGVSIQYQAPTTITQNSQSYSWVNGDPRTARIESSSATFISDWERLGLPAPPTGTYWIYENGRYVLVPNR